MSQDRINPDEWNLEELVKHTYREIKNIREDSKKEKAELRREIRSLNGKFQKLNDELNRRKGAYAVIAIILGFLSGLLAKLIN